MPSAETVRNDPKAAADWSPAQRRVNAAMDQGLRNPLYPWLRVREASDSELSAIWGPLTEQWRESQTRLNERHETEYSFRWSAHSEHGKTWIRHGNGMDEGPAPAGSFHLADEGESIISGIYPSGVYSHLLSSKHSGQFTSPSFGVDSPAIWIRAAGSQARARYVMHNYARAEGPIYGMHELNSEELQWRQWDMNYWQGDQAHLEFATSRDVPVETGDHQRSWFGVSEVLALGAGQAAPQDEAAEYVSPLFRSADNDGLKARQELLGWYVDALRQCIEAWRSDTMTDDQARFLDYFARNDALRNRLEDHSDVASLVVEYRRLEAEIPVPTRAPGLIEAEPGDKPLYVRGNHKQPGELVPRRFLEALDPTPFTTPASGRLELANAILAKENPLTSRVIVNRVWHHLFGRGIVASADNFGHLGEVPTHPALLDSLAKKFEAEGYSIKKLVRHMVTSHAYQIDSVPNKEAVAGDPDNHLLSHMRVRRLEAEAIRDALLQLSGEVDLEMFGPPVDGKAPRRSVYVRVQRNALDPFLSAFDAPAPFSTKGRRDLTNVPAQALTMMNSDFVRSCTDKWSERVAGDSSLLDDQHRIDRFFQEAFARHATPTELANTMRYLEQLRGARNDTTVDEQDRELAVWRQLAHSLVGFKEFLYLR